MDRRSARASSDNRSLRTIHFPGVGTAHWSSTNTDREISALSTHRSSGVLHVCVGIVQWLRTDAPGQHIA